MLNALFYSFMELQVIKVRPFAKEYLMFIYIAVKAFYSHLPIIIYALMRKNADVIIIKLNNKVIGGFILSDLPLNIFRLKNLLSKQKRDCLWKFIKMGYRYLTYVVIDKKHRNKGYGKELFNRAKKEYNIKSYLTPFT